MSAIIGYLEWMMPATSALFLGTFLGAAIGAVCVWLQRPQRGRRRPSPLWAFGLFVIGVFAILWVHTQLIHATGDVRVLGGFIWTDDAARFLRSSPGATPIDVISAFNGWTNPKLVWTSSSLFFSRVVATMSIALLVGGAIALGQRLPSFLNWLGSVPQGWRSSN